MHKRRCSIMVIAPVFTCMLMHSCAQEYSFEGAPVDDMLPVIDSSKFQQVILPDCHGCATDTAQYRWTFKLNVSDQCGKVTDAVLTPDRTAFTFFGPSYCSRDTGLIIEAFFPQPFNADRYHYAARAASIQYYDNVRPSDVFTSWNIKGFQLVIDTFSVQTGRAKGRFSGYVTTENGDTAHVYNGRFSIRFRQ